MAVTKTGVEAARRDLPKLVDQASRGKTSLITRHGVVCAAIVPPDQVRALSGKLGLLELRGTGKGLWGASVKRAIARMRDEW